MNQSATSPYSLGPKNEEVLTSEFEKHLQAINQMIADANEPMEGNLFYLHGAVDYLTSPPQPRTIHKRRNVHLVLKHKPNFLEVGFNAGHTALLALSSNPELRYYGIDIAKHTYTRACGEYLQENFPGRVELMFGDSRKVMPELITQGRKFSCIHVDGGHSAAVCRSDLQNSIALAAPGAHLILDDTNAMRITDVYNEFLARGHFVTESLGAMWEQRGNILARFI